MSPKKETATGTGTVKASEKQNNARHDNIFEMESFIDETGRKSSSSFKESKETRAGTVIIEM